MSDLSGLGPHLRTLHEKRDLKVVDVAARMHVDRSHISRIELGDYDIRLSTLIRYCEAIGARIHIGFPKEGP